MTTPTTPVGRSVTVEENDTQPTDEVQLNEGFITDIDAAMKDKVSGMRVTDEASSGTGRTVRAFFRWPTAEVTDATFPFVTIDLLRFERANQREQRASSPNIPYVPNGFTADQGYDPDDDPDFLGPMYAQRALDMAIPFDFTYQLTLHSRRAVHDRQLSMQMLRDDRFPPRGAYLVVGDTVRQMFVSGPTNADGLDPEQGGRSKRHFRKVWTAVVSGEFFQKDIEMLSRLSTLVTNVEAISTTG